MARVVPVGPIDPELCAFAKKEAEKAERNPRYVPKKMETPAHSVFYRRVGEAVKAFVLDKIAPITYPSAGGVHPLNFDLYKKNDRRPTAGSHLDERQGLVTGTLTAHIPVILSTPPLIGNTGFSSWFFGDPYPNLAGFAYMEYLGLFTTYDPEYLETWESLFGGLPPEVVGVVEQGSWSGTYEIRRRANSCIVEIDETQVGFHSPWLPTGVNANIKLSRNVAYSFVTVGDLRNVKSLDSLLNACSTLVENAGVVEADDALTGGLTTNSKEAKYDCLELDVFNTYFAANGDWLAPGIHIDALMSSDSGGNGWIAHRIELRHVISKNFRKGEYILEENRVVEWVQAPLAPVSSYYALAKPATHQTLFVMASVHGFDGIVISMNFYEIQEFALSGFPHGYKLNSIEYDESSMLVSSGVGGYFGLQPSVNDVGKYVLDREVQRLGGSVYRYLSLLPIIEHRGICLDHAWFFPVTLHGHVENSRTIGILVYPAGKKNFDLSDADVKFFKIHFEHESNSENPLFYILNIWCSHKSKAVYVTFWDGMSCEISSFIKLNDAGEWIKNADWQERCFRYKYAPGPNYELSKQPNGVFRPHIHAYLNYLQQESE